MARHVTGFASRSPSLAQAPGPSALLAVLPFDESKRSLGTDWPAPGPRSIQIPMRMPPQQATNGSNPPSTKRTGRSGRDVYRLRATRNMNASGWAALPSDDGPSTMIGLRRCENFADAIWHVHRMAVPGDVLEAGVWRGGASALAITALQHIWDSECDGLADPDEVENVDLDPGPGASLSVSSGSDSNVSSQKTGMDAEGLHRVTRCALLRFRSVWLADTFEGLPPPQGPEDELATAEWHRLDYAVASLEEVVAAMRRSLEWAGLA